jgi:tRNA A-37 threonylcarbamoyl transferase component Bud32
MSEDPSLVIARRLQDTTIVRDVEECAAYVRVGGVLTRAVFDAVISVADRDAVFAEFVAPSAVDRVEDTAVFGGQADAFVGANAQPTASSSSTSATETVSAAAGSVAWTDALLDLLHQVCIAVELGGLELATSFLESRLAPFVTHRFSEAFLQRSNLLSEAQRARVPPILRAVYSRFPESRPFTRAMLQQYVSKVLREAPSSAASPAAAVEQQHQQSRGASAAARIGALSTIVETNEMSQMAPPSATAAQKHAFAHKSPNDIAEDEDEEEAISGANDNRHQQRASSALSQQQFIASMHRQARPDPTGVHPRILAAQRAKEQQHALKRRAVSRAASLYADADEKRLLSALPGVLDLLGAIGGGLCAAGDAKHKPLFDLLERLLLRGGMLDELTALASLYHTSLTRCLAAWCASDATGALLQRVCSAIEHNWPLSSKRQQLLVQVLEAALASETPLGQRRAHLLRFLCGTGAIGGVDFTVQQRLCVLFNNAKACNTLFAAERHDIAHSNVAEPIYDESEHASLPSDDTAHLRAMANASVMHVVQALVAAAHATFSDTTRKMLVRAACNVAEYSAVVKSSPVVQMLEEQRAAERAVEEEEALFKRGRARERRTDLTFMKLAWHKYLGTGALATVRSALAIEPGVKQSLWTEYAIKVMRKEQIEAEHARGRIEAEAELLESLNHPNLVGFISFFEDDKRIFLVMELAGGGDVHTVIVRMGSVDAAWARFVAAEAAAALTYLHELHIVHFDVKPENLLLNDQGHVLLADFGSCLRWDGEAQRAAAPEQADPARVLLTSTAEYLSLELAKSALESNDADAKALYVDAALAGPPADWWALGVTLYQMLRGRVPYSCAARRGNEGEPLADRAKLQAIVQQAQTIGPLFTRRSANDSNAQLDECEAATRALLHRDPAQRWRGGTPAAAAFFRVPKKAPKAPVRGEVAASEVAAHDKQRKFSMFTAMVQRAFVDDVQQSELEPIPEVEGY